MLKKLVFLIILSLLSALTAFGKEPPPKSKKLVNDYIGLLSPTETERLERKLKNYFDSTSTQIAVVIEASLDGDNAADYAYSIGRAWGVGEKGKNNGVLIFVSRDDRKVFIATGYGVEGFLPDATAKDIVDNIIRPAFKKQQYFQGLDGATDAILGKGKGEFTRDKSGGLRTTLMSNPSSPHYNPLLCVERRTFEGGNYIGPWRW